MDYIECPFCPTQLPTKAHFCSQCGSSVRCVGCKEPLEKDAKACIYCGTKIESQVDSTEAIPLNHNVFEFDEGPRHRRFKAVFSDEVGNNLGHALGIVLAGRSLNIPRANSKKSSSDFEAQGSLFNNNISQTEDIINKLPSIQEDVKAEDVTNAEHPIRNIFSIINGEIILSETRLKAKGKLDFAQRLTYLLLSYYKLNKSDQVAKADLVSFLTKLNIHDSHWGSWIKGNNKDFYHSQDDNISLIKPGNDLTSIFLKEVLDDSIENTWDLNNAARNKKRIYFRFEQD
ncbi:zinc ribbon domain-containing protein [Hymenobacter puniceus]|uniref:zinc ribbon domain-containing protein n=1 Tax=Hymenobacter sp. BT190 TaxID=2763505 RepID=UPI0016513A6F|nr:zinc ribbon domain-containing protein [Hymenobacter sp. BT190]MBC6697172.1 zinc ribbon domain-containing protein [Hymenobacter sp. BT190]